MGAVVSLSHALRYPELWGRIGCVSSAFWYGDPPAPGELPAWLEAHAPAELPDRIWLDVGTAESSAHVADPTTYIEQSRRVRDRLLALNLPLGARLAYLEQPQAVHSEGAWEARLPQILLYLLGDNHEALFREVEAIELHLVQPRLSLATPEGTQTVVQRLHPRLTQTLPGELAAYSGDDPTVAEVSAGGGVRPLAVGTTVVRVRDAGHEASAALEVVEGERATLTWSVQTPAGTPAEDGVFLAGNLPELGEWGEGWSVMRQMVPLGGGRWGTSLTLPWGTVAEYKYTRGSWDTVEKEAGGGERPNRQATADGPWTLEDEVIRWADR